MTKRTKIIIGVASLIVIAVLGITAAASGNKRAVQGRLEPVKQRNLAAQGENLISKQAVEDAETGYQVTQELLHAAGYGVEQARAGVNEAQDQLDKTVIRSPMSGVVTRLKVEEGETAIVGTMNNSG